MKSHEARSAEAVLELPDGSTDTDVSRQSSPAYGPPVTSGVRHGEDCPHCQSQHDGPKIEGRGTHVDFAAGAILQRNPPNGGFTGRFKDVKMIRWSVRPAPWVQVVQYKMVCQAQGVTWSR
jgi:hypothetical protein